MKQAYTLPTEGVTLLFLAIKTCVEKQSLVGQQSISSIEVTC